MRWLVTLFLVGCARQVQTSVPTGPLDAVLVPGCPSRDDGSLSGCQWQRVLWAHHVWEQGGARALVTSGNAVHNRFIEAEAMKAGLVALGVPAESVLLETQALHTDENASYALEIFRERGWTQFGVASHGGQARGIRQFWKGWGEPPVAVFEMDLGWVIRRMGQPLPDVRTEPVPTSEWLPLREREQELARRADRAKRPHSFWVYSWATLAGTFGTYRRPLPPVREPTLDGHRYRVDTAPW